jgi:hypothetical protein
MEKFLYLIRIFMEKLQYFLRSFRGTGKWAKCRFRYKTGTEFQMASPYRPNKGHDKHFAVPV